MYEISLTAQQLRLLRHPLLSQSQKSLEGTSAIKLDAHSSGSAMKILHGVAR